MTNDEQVAVPTQAGTSQDGVREFAIERYRYILQQIHTVNENVYKILAVYQTLATAVVGAALGLSVGYQQWGIHISVARAGVIGLLWLATFIAGFTSLMIFIGVLAWLDYRHEECELTDREVYVGFRKKPRVGNFFRWYETYIILFIVGSITFMWIYANVYVLPAMK